MENSAPTTKAPSSGLAKLEVKSDWQEMLDVIRGKYPDATVPELNVFFYQAKRLGLDPLSGQIHLIPRKDTRLGKTVSTIQTGIDGYRAIAARTKQYAGSDDYLFDSGLTQFQAIAKKLVHPNTATVTVYRMLGGVRCPFVATATWEAYFPTNEKSQFMWRKFPFLMLGKCAEALALRKAFPKELSGIEVAEEMDQAGPILSPAQTASTAVPYPTAAKEEPKVAPGPVVDVPEVKPNAEVKPKATPAPAPKEPAKPKPILSLDHLKAALEAGEDPKVSYESFKASCTDPKLKTEGFKIYHNWTK